MKNHITKVFFNIFFLFFLCTLFTTKAFADTCTSSVTPPENYSSCAAMSGGSVCGGAGKISCIDQNSGNAFCCDMSSGTPVNNPPPPSGNINTGGSNTTIVNPTGLNSIGAIINVFLPIFFGIIGFALFIMIIFGGFTWLTSAGNPEKVKKAQGILTAAVIGFAIVSLSGFIVHFILNALAVNSQLQFSFVTPIYAQCSSGVNQIFGGCVVSTGNSITDSNTNVPALAGSIVDLLVAIAGFIALVFVIWGGIKWTTSSGDTQKIGEARKMIVSALVGLGFVLLSWVITNGVMNILGVGTGSGGAVRNTPCTYELNGQTLIGKMVGNQCLPNPAG